MKRDKKIVLIAHCILNCNSKVEGLSQYRGALSEVVSLLMEQGLGIIQLPCPELTVYGVKRWGHVKEQFNTPYFRKHCREVFKPYLEQIKDYQAADYQIVGLLGIEGSPSCGVNRSCSGDWGGTFSSPKLEFNLNNVKSIDGAGIFIEEIREIFKEEEIGIPIIGVDEKDLKQTFKIIKGLS
ncbi:putative secreted protein [Orenia metallireducens]|jgi:predicted secreted protein|uniref:Predicted secreted protein n=1 Tax=Orenia metallireducens TaxID=1413210 RepID=A0A285GG00_9FIRM|nr:CD3072 family TudS-related putative desulfidase [Orenia metallireducens]PRX30432.1 putative secreted protein [Orenia metallireducens]SNY22512.1 Predicted secreted protein [Orenia metallireducens]